MDHGVSKGHGAELRETERERFFCGLGRTVVGPFLADLVRWLLARSQDLKISVNSTNLLFIYCIQITEFDIGF